MKRKPLTRERQRCSECRRWYLPAASAEKTQKTCSERCRLRRRARRQRERRSEDLANARQDERERQRRHRERERDRLAADAHGPDPPLSLTGLSLHVPETIEQTIEDSGQAHRLSLTGLRRRLRRIALKTPGEMERGAENFGT